MERELIFWGLLTGQYIIAGLGAIKEAKGDADNKADIKHARDFAIRVAVCLTVTLIFNLVFNIDKVLGVAGAFLQAGSMGFFYGIIFNLAFNHYDERPLLQVGSSAVLDKIFKRHGGLGQLIVYLGGFIIFSIMYYGTLFLD